MREESDLLWAAQDLIARHKNAKTIKSTGISSRVIGPTWFPGVYVEVSEAARVQMDRSSAQLKEILFRA